ncbi:MAG: hypothetical protein ACO1N1_09190 [Dyadobacter fermentans]
MKNLIYFFAFIITISLSSCDLFEKKPFPEPDTDNRGTVTEVGEPVGPLVTKQIGAQGGTITSADGSVQLTLPAGALKTDTPISIQAISNHAPNGVGFAYRFLPEGTVFAQPGQLSFHYNRDDVTLNDQDNFLVSYQKEDGIWYNVRGARADTSAHIVTVPMEHFSDWSSSELSYIETFEIETGENPEVLFYNEQMKLAVHMLAVLVDADKLEPIQVKKTGNDIKWEVVGKNNGTIQTGVGLQAVYTAPMSTPSQNPVTITATINFKNGKKLILVKQIVVGTGYMKLNFQGKQYNFSAVLDEYGNTYFDVAGALAGNVKASLTFMINAGSQGICKFGDPSRPSNTFTCAAEMGINGKQWLTSPGYCDDNVITTPGQLMLTKYIPGKIVKGHFSGEMFPFDSESGCGPLTGPKFSGEFIASPMWY